MTALALAAHDRGWNIQGSDGPESFITDEVLRSRGINVCDRFTPRNLHNNIDLLIYTAAHHGINNVEVKWAMSRGIKTLNYAKALAEFFQSKKQICICGVGGKTTTAALLATILHSLGTSVSWVVGTSEVTSLPAPGHWDQLSEWAILESDEYVADPIEDKTPKFLYLNPQAIICTNIYYDHPDVFPTPQDTIHAYGRFIRSLPPDGMLFVSSQVNEVLKPAGAVVYDADPKLQALVQGAIQVPGEYNVKNAMAAVLAAEYMGISRENAVDRLRIYTGSKRRFELIADINGVKIYDDYAHHPKEITALSLAAKAQFPPPARIRFVFQPHTFSRTKSLFAEFVESLLSVDEAILFPIFPSAREVADESISSEMISQEIIRRGRSSKYVSTESKLVKYLCQTSRNRDVIFTVGAGDINKIYESLIECLAKRRRAVAGGPDAKK